MNKKSSKPPNELQHMQHIKDSNSGNSHSSNFVPTFMEPKKYINNQLALSATTTASTSP
jgi:hypothetical protein